MSMTVTLALLAVALVVLGYAIWKVNHPPEPGTPRLVDFHYVVFAGILATGLLALHALMLAMGR